MGEKSYEVAILIVIMIIVVAWYQTYCSVKCLFKKLWSDHVWWTREYIIANSRGQELKSTEDRLMQNQVDIGKALGKYYGAAFGEAVTGLLKEHITLMGAVLNGGNPTQIQALYKNGLDIANGLAAKMGSLEHWKMMMTAHLDLTIKEAQFIADEDPRNVQVFEAVLQDVLAMGGMMAFKISTRPWKLLL